MRLQLEGPLLESDFSIQLFNKIGDLRTWPREVLDTHLHAYLGSLNGVKYSIMETKNYYCVKPYNFYTFLVFQGYQTAATGLSNATDGTWYYYQYHMDFKKVPYDGKLTYEIPYSCRLMNGSLDSRPLLKLYKEKVAAL